ncbi:trans-sulfuration enzyme family protein [Roseibium sp.]|uniref:trans-sulfuration enzyme family protein n=1 Tax=Roseibium sp. TaxID=1936156 RepID=UPI003BAA2506
MNSARLADTLVHGGRPHGPSGRQVNWPVEMGSTVVFDTLDAFEAARDARYEGGTPYYGRYGNDATFSLETLLAELDCADGVTLTSSGVSAITSALLTVARPSMHVLVAENLYGNTRVFCDGLLAALNVDIEPFDPLEGIGGRLRDNTCAVMAEAPGSGTFEVCDLLEISRAARQRGIPVIFDNTWASPVFCKPLALGADIVVYSGSKHLCGHSDAMLGVIAANGDYHAQVRRTVMSLGDKPGAQEVFLALRGARTLKMRMEHQDRAGREIAAWLADQDCVARLLHPAFDSCPGHETWKRDFTGAAALFSVIFKPVPEDRFRTFVDSLTCFGIGVSWGGFESLVLPMTSERSRRIADGPLLRFSIGFDDLETLKADLTQAFKLLQD